MPLILAAAIFFAVGWYEWKQLRHKTLTRERYIIVTLIAATFAHHLITSYDPTILNPYHVIKLTFGWADRIGFLK